MKDEATLVERPINCHRCWTEATCRVALRYTEAGRIAEARVEALPQGWDYEPLGTAGGRAPLCPRCQSG